MSLTWVGLLIFLMLTTTLALLAFMLEEWRKRRHPPDRTSQNPGTHHLSKQRHTEP